MTTLELAALAEAMVPYGIESFDEVLKPLWLPWRGPMTMRMLFC